MLHKETLLDIIIKHPNRQIHFNLYDGENIVLTGLEEFVRYLIDNLGIADSQIKISTHQPDYKFRNCEIEVLIPGIFISTGRQLVDQSFSLTANAKKFGCCLGRLNINRLCLAYQLDTQIHNDVHLIFQPERAHVRHQFRPFADLYSQELNWLDNYVPPQRQKSQHEAGLMGWQESCATYADIWGLYRVEIVSETDAYSDFWFTEKTAKCLATAKPFILMSGKGSLHRLEHYGFDIGRNIIDVSYDLAPNPAERISRIVDLMKSLSDSQIAELEQLAVVNKEKYYNLIDDNDLFGQLNQQLN